MVEILISVVVPVYNGAKYINKMVDTLKNTNSDRAEFIFVDDGSTDATLDILKNLTRNDKRFIVISKENGGVSSARNHGIEASKGKYIWFIDVDDIVTDEAIDDICEYVSVNSYDIVFFDSVFYYTAVNKYISAESFDVLHPFEKKEDVSKFLIKNLLKSRTRNSIWNKLINAELIKNNNILFPVGITNGEDGMFLIDCYDKAQSFSYIKKMWYTYIIHTSSATSKTSLKKFYSNKAAFIKKMQYVKKYSITGFEENLKNNFLNGNFKALTRVKKFSLLYKIVRELRKDYEISEIYKTTNGTGVLCKIYKFLHLYSCSFLICLYIYLIHLIKKLK